MAELGDRRMTADPRITRGAEYACGVTAGCAGCGSRRAVFSALVVGGIYTAVSGVTFGADRFINAVSRSAGAVLCAVDRCSDSVNRAPCAFTVVRSAAYVVISAGEIVTKSGNGFRFGRVTTVKRTMISFYTGCGTGGLRGDRA